VRQGYALGAVGYSLFVRAVREEPKNRIDTGDIDIVSKGKYTRRFV